MVAKNKYANKLGRIGVLMGGSSSERKISLKSGKAVYDSLVSAGLDVVAIDITSDDLGLTSKLILSKRIDVAFIALHGRFGEDGEIQYILEKLGIPYTGSGIKASRLALDKISSHHIFRIHGLAVPRYKVFDSLNRNFNFSLLNKFSYPLVVKPATHGSSIGLSIIENKHRLLKAMNLAFRFDDQIIVEEYIKGREMTVGILDDQTLPIIEIIPRRRFFDYQAKYKPGITRYIVPAKLDKKIAQGVSRAGLLAHNYLGCFGFSRVDMILRGSQPFVLEVNTIPGLTQMSLLPKAAKAVGINFDQLCIRLVKLAYERFKRNV